jgi:hypothetical protein
MRRSGVELAIRSDVGQAGGKKEGRRTSALVVRDFKISSPLRLSWDGAPPQLPARAARTDPRGRASPRCVGAILCVSGGISVRTGTAGGLRVTMMWFGGMG